MSEVTVTREELTKHTTDEDIWIAIKGKVYDVTGFMQNHPGGLKPLQHYAGKDGTDGFNAKHPNLDISKIDMVKCMGDLQN